MHVYGSVRVIFPVTRTRVHTNPYTCDWILLIVTSERDNQNCRFGFSAHL